MKNQLFIPKKCRAGFQNRKGTYTKKLAYIIYYGPKGEIRKERSWKSWRDDKIEPLEFDNTPSDGFVLNKGIQRYNWSSFGSNRSMVRVYDNRGIEFEITPINLLFILMHTNCSKRELEGEFVYGWTGGDLVLLPTCCEEYKQSVEFTNLQDKKVYAKDMILGATYETKHQDLLIYLGRFDFWEKYCSYRDRKKLKNAFVFWDTKKKEMVGIKSVPSLLSRCTEEERVDNYAELIESFQNSQHSGEPLELTWKKVSLEQLFAKDEIDYYGRPKTHPSIGKTTTVHSLQKNSQDKIKIRPCEEFAITDGDIKRNYVRSHYRYYDDKPIITPEEQNNLYELHVKLSNGSTINLSNNKY